MAGRRVNKGVPNPPCNALSRSRVRRPQTYKLSRLVAEMSYQISVLWYHTPQNSSFPWAIFVVPSHSSAPSTTRIHGTKYSCYYNPQTCGWEYCYTTNY